MARKLTYACGVHLVSSFSWRAGDVPFTQADLASPRTVLVQPGDRVVLLDDRPISNESSLPDALLWGNVPESNHEIFHFDELPNVSFQIVHFEKLVKPKDDEINSGVKQRIVDLLTEAWEAHQAGLETHEHAARISETINSVFRDVCLDDPVIGTELERKLRATLSAFTDDLRKMAWAVRHMLDGGYLAGDEVCLAHEASACSNSEWVTCQERNTAQLRLHVWTDLAGQHGMRYYSGVHEHGSALFAATQITGALKHFVVSHEAPNRQFHSTAARLSLQRRGWRKSDGIPFHNSIDLGATSITGYFFQMEPGMTYIWPPRWMHAVQPPAAGTSMSLELRIYLRNPVCGNHTPFVESADTSSVKGLNLSMRHDIFSERLAQCFERNFICQLGFGEEDGFQRNHDEL